MEMKTADSVMEVVCKVCENDLTEEYNDPSNWEPDEDLGRGRAIIMAKTHQNESLLSPQELKLFAA